MNNLTAWLVTAGSRDQEMLVPDVTLRVRSFGRIWIRISDPRTLRSWRTKGTEPWFVGSVTMTIGAKSVKVGVHAKAVSTWLNRAFLPISRSRFKQR